MSKTRILVTRRAGKDLEGLGAQIKQRIGKKIQKYTEQDDPLKFAEPLSESADAQYRFRVGVYRVLFDVKSDTIVILRVQHRREVYRK